MNAARARASAAALSSALAMGLSGCFSSPPQTAHRPETQPPTAPPALPESAPSPQTVPDAVPRYEPRSAHGNPAFYEVFGKRYYVLSSSADYVERGVASWYGPGFHKILTSTRETYDMYGMTAAHRTLPLPAYVRVTNLQNGRSIVVRVNDRGPFVGNRIIDLSYTAAAKLDMLRSGTAMVEVRTVQPASPAGGSNIVVAPSPVSSAPAAALFVQAGAFANPANAEGLADKLKGGRYGHVFVRNDSIGGRTMYRVRIGPVPDVPEFDRIVAALERAGVHDAHLALD